jgi:hypothetical protein
MGALNQNWNTSMGLFQKNKGLSPLMWCLAGSNHGHMDFQSIALPTELRHLKISVGKDIQKFIQ